MRTIILLTTTVILMLGVFSNTTVKAQQARQTIAHQGVLLDNNGDPVEDDTYIFTFKIYADSSGGSALWQVDKILTVENGLFNTQLGSEKAINLPFDQQYWVGIAIDGGSELTPRMPLSATPYAFHAYTIADSSVTTKKLADGSVTNKKLGNGSVTNAKLADNVEASHYTVFGALNYNFTDVSDSWTKLQISSGSKTFQKQHNSSKVELFLHSRASSGSFSGASRISYELRINGNSAGISIPQYLFSSSVTKYITLKAVFENLAAGEHSVEVWARTDAGSSTDVVLDPGGFRGKIIVKEIR